MVEAGEDPRFIARRLVILASEDIGLADPTALPTAVAAHQAVQLIGLPEGRIPLAQAVIALALAPKSNAVIVAIGARGRRRTGRARRPGARRTCATRTTPGAKKLGHGKGYRYSHDHPHGVVEQQYAPDAVVGRDYYQPDRARRRARRCADARRRGCAPRSAATDPPAAERARAGVR